MKEGKEPHTGFSLLRHNMANIVPRTRAENGPQALRALFTLLTQAVPFIRLLAMADHVHGRFRECERAESEQGKDAHVVVVSWGLPL